MPMHTYTEMIEVTETLNGWRWVHWSGSGQILSIGPVSEDQRKALLRANAHAGRLKEPPPVVVQENSDA